MTLRDMQNLIIKHYGEEKQFDMLVEECAEMIQSIQKMKRYPEQYNFYRTTTFMEMADVLNLIQQLSNIHFINLEELIIPKCERQLKRIEEEQTKWIFKNISKT